MAILINLERQPYTTLNSEINTRIDVGLQALQHYMHGYFEPTDLEVWERAPVAELDGVKLHSIQLNVGDHRDVRKK